ncbi:MAG: DUF4911 domain-containing protein [Synergistaceae bacterium]|jgi:hypothetical protein|nr:DUF4911 domain-containing protein [Synergistaceae bacterium]
MMETVTLLRREIIAPKESICYMSWTLDAYDGLGFLRTDDPEKGQVSILFPSCRLEELEGLLCAFESEGIALRRVGLYDEETRPNII